VVATCTQCHGNIPQVHEQVIAGELWKYEGAVPVCVECHPPHEVRQVFYDTGVADKDCMSCHGDSTIVASDDGRSLFVDAEERSRSVHAREGTTCAQCHVGVTPSASLEQRSCRTITEKVQCASCHEAEAVRYERGVHGQLAQKGDADAPGCIDCHGRHEILEHEVPENASAEITALVRSSRTFSRNVPDLCGRCHQDGAEAAMRYFGEEERIVESYRMSIHGKGLLDSGLTVTATCTACHTAHMALPAEDPDSSVNHKHIAATCGQCHDGIYEQFEHSIHSDQGNPDYEARQVRGMPDLPHCNDCHSAHTVGRTDVADFRLDIMEQCGYCHEESTSSYFQSYHGKASALGDATRAKCYDCHGAHDILPISNPASSLSDENVVGTCANCHEGAHLQFARYLSHASHHDRSKYPVLFWTYWGMTILLVGTFGFFGLHVLAWLPRSWKLRREVRSKRRAEDPNALQYRRFTRLQRQLHATMIVSFFGLAITGMMLKFSGTGWAQFLFRILGGTDSAGFIHRVCGLITFGYFFTHVVNALARYRKSDKPLLQYLFGADSMMFHKRDLQEFWGTLKWFFGRGPRPQYGRWTYWEKFDYFAVFWGVTVIGSTGLCLWFPEFFTRFLPGQAINVAAIIHSDEALLATGFIFTIHFFNTHCRPEKFPMDMVIFTGRMSVEELEQDKPRLYEQLVKSGELERHLRPPASSRFVHWVRLFGYLALVVGFLLVILIVNGLLSSPA
jgi:cytochrome b subunit of formate dehydrogenase